MEQNSSKTSEKHTREKLSGIISAIEFFTQKFDAEQIVEYAFEFSWELLHAQKLALWYHKDSTLKLYKSEGFKSDPLPFAFKEDYNNIVYFHAGLLQKEHLAQYFPPEIIAAYPADYGLPLIMDKKLFGVIFISLGEGGRFEEGDEMVALALMNLFSVSLTNLHGYENLEKAKLKLDEKIFNLFAINQSSKALLSEHDIENLYDLSISVFSELTQSSVTAFFIKDKVSENYIMTGFKNVFNRNDGPEHLILYPDSRQLPSYLPVVIDLTNMEQKDTFMSYFYNAKSLFEQTDPLYVVNLGKDGRLVGFVTLGKKVNEKNYDNGVFE